MIARKKKCIGCGFLCVDSGTRIIEYSPKERTDGLERIESGFNRPKCYRRNISFETEYENIIANCPRQRDEFGDSFYPKTELAASYLKLITTPRKCDFFTPYIPGYSPELHLSKWETDARERSNHIWNFIYFLLGIVATIIGGIIVNKVIS